jgi:hypothetical protein
MPDRRKDQGPRPLAVIIPRMPWMPEQGGDELATAVREDLVELLGALRLRVEHPAAAQPVAVSQTLSQSDRPVVLAFTDVPALPTLSVEGALEDLDENALVVGPCADGSVYLLAVAPGIEPEPLGALAEAVCGLPGEMLASITDIADEFELPAAMLPPWFRMGGNKDLSFAESVARLSLMSEEGEDDFLADRLRLWFERYAQE